MEGRHPLRAHELRWEEVPSGATVEALRCCVPAFVQSRRYTAGAPLTTLCRCCSRVGGMQCCACLCSGCILDVFTLEILDVEQRNNVQCQSVEVCRKSHHRIGERVPRGCAAVGPYVHHSSSSDRECQRTAPVHCERGLRCVRGRTRPS